MRVADPIFFPQVKKITIRPLWAMHLFLRTALSGTRITWASDVTRVIMVSPFELWVSSLSLVPHPNKNLWCWNI